MFGRKKGRGLVGLDIGSSALKIIQLARTEEGIQLAAAGFAALPPEAVTDGTVADVPGVAGSIQSIFDAAHIASTEVASSICGHSVIVKRIPLPLMTEEELFQRIPEEAAQHIPFDIADVSVGYQLIARSDSGLDVLLVAARKEKIENHSSVLAQAGKKARVLDVDAFALENCFEANYEPHPGELIALLNVGASMMNINITRDGAPLFTRDVSMGGAQFTEALQKEFDLSYADAEGVKAGKQHPSVPASDCAALLRSISELLVMEIKKTFDFFRATTSAENISYLCVAGGTSRLAGLLDVMRADLGLPAEEMDPFRRIHVPADAPHASALKENAPRMAVAVGLALRELEES